MEKAKYSAINFDLGVWDHLNWLDLPENNKFRNYRELETAHFL